MGLSRNDGRDSTEVQNAADIDVEMLPLYNETENHPPAEAAEAPKLPEKTATPAQVRDSLLQTLMMRGLPQDRAAYLASKWTTGTGRELRDYPINIFRSIYDNDEECWAVLIAIRVEQEREAIAHEPSRLHNLYMFLFCALVTLALGFGAYKVENALGKTFLIVFCGISAFISIVILCMTCSTREDAETKASSWLTKNWPNPDKPAQASSSESSSS